MPEILLAIDGCTQLDRLLPAALLLASEQHSALRGVFAQDSALLQGAALPFTHEVGENSAACYPLTANSIARRMRRIAENMRRRLAAAAESQQLPWEFRICAGSILQITTEAQADVVLPGWNAIWSVARTSTSLSTRKTSASPVIVVVDDGSQSSAHVIDAARRLTITAGPHQLVILTMSLTAESPRKEPGAVARGKPTEVVIRVASMEQLIRQIRLLRPTVVLLGRDQTLAADRQLQNQLALIRCPLALVQATW